MLQKDKFKMVDIIYNIFLHTNCITTKKLCLLNKEFNTMYYNLNFWFDKYLVNKLPKPRKTANMLNNMINGYKIKKLYQVCNKMSSIDVIMKCLMIKNNQKLYTNVFMFTTYASIFTSINNIREYINKFSNLQQIVLHIEKINDCKYNISFSKCGEIACDETEIIHILSGLVKNNIIIKDSFGLVYPAWTPKVFEERSFYMDI